MVQLITSGGAGPQNFAGMAIHMGNLIRETIEAKQMSVSAVAEMIGVHRNTMHRIFAKPSVETDVITRISKVLKVDLYRPLSVDLGMSQSGVAEPDAPYGKRNAISRVIIEMSDDASPASKGDAVTLIERIRKAVE